MSGKYEKNEWKIWKKIGGNMKKKTCAKEGKYTNSEKSQQCEVWNS